MLLVVAGAVLGLVLDGPVWEPLAETLASWFISLLLAVVIGVIIGFPLGVSRVTYRMSVVTLDFLRTIPALVFVPLVVLLDGAGLQSTILLAFFGAVWAMVMQTIYGARDLGPRGPGHFPLLRRPPLQTVTRLLLPTALPYMATGVRLAAAICLLISISAQIVIPAGGFRGRYRGPPTQWCAPGDVCLHRAVRGAGHGHRLNVPLVRTQRSGHGIRRIERSSS